MSMKKLFKKPRIIILIVCLIFAIVAIHPNYFQEGVAIRNVQANSSASNAGIASPKPTSTPMSREVITSVDRVPIKNLEDYVNKVKTIKPNQTVYIATSTNSQGYVLKASPSGELGLVVYEAPQTNIRKGLDLQGGTRVLLQPETKLNQDDIGILIDNMKQRLNVYGLSDLIIREANDLPPPLGTGNQYIVVEIAGASQEEVKDLLAKQGKFEARIGNETVFAGGQDVRSVCRSADCAGIDPQSGCGPSGEEWV